MPSGSLHSEQGSAAHVLRHDSGIGLTVVMSCLRGLTCRGFVRDEWPGDLFQIIRRHGFAHADLARAHPVALVAVSAKQMIPNHPELAEVDLGVFIVPLVMPAVNFRDAEQTAEGPETVVEIGVLKRQVDGDDREPAADRNRRRTQHHRDAESRHRQHQGTERMAALTVEPGTGARRCGAARAAATGSCSCDSANASAIVRSR